VRGLKEASQLREKFGQRVRWLRGEHGLTQEQLAHTLFPLGRMTKPEVREVARQHGLALAEKPDSQEI